MALTGGFSGSLHQTLLAPSMIPQEIDRQYSTAQHSLRRIRPFLIILTAFAYVAWFLVCSLLTQPGAWPEEPNYSHPKCLLVLLRVFGSRSSWGMLLSTTTEPAATLLNLPCHVVLCYAIPSQSQRTLSDSIFRAIPSITTALLSAG